MSGFLAADPVSSSPNAPSRRDGIDLSFVKSYSLSKGASIPIDAADISPFVIPFEGITNVHVLAIVSRGGGPIKVFLTSDSGGADQEVPGSEVLLMHVPNVGDAFTAIKLSGAGDVEYLIAGN